ncbi:hypothetical protein TL16_g03930 [Triparma laevis f. inornata]|uniref:Uncharacterized protein n=1 Tax=Triparma laevis f. inornata TaxID=1714386 RepID=A0A9W7A6H7_9STRA|nr:hypothetical protein TL16_g03930 [Triparma laevis f. inornata]
MSKVIRVPFHVGDTVKHGTSSTHYTVHTIYSNGITIATSDKFLKAQPEDLRIVKKGKKGTTNAVDGSIVDERLDLKLTVPMIRRTMKVDKSLKHFSIQAARLLSVAATTFIEELGGLIDESALPTDFISSPDGTRNLNITYSNVRKAIHSQEEFKFARSVVPMKEEEREREEKRKERVAMGLSEEVEERPVVYKAGMEPVVQFIDPGPDPNDPDTFDTTTTTTTTTTSKTSKKTFNRLKKKGGRIVNPSGKHNNKGSTINPYIPVSLPPPPAGANLIRANISARIKAQPLKMYGQELEIGEHYKSEIDRTRTHRKWEAKRNQGYKKIKTWKTLKVVLKGETYGKLSDLPREDKRKRERTLSKKGAKKVDKNKKRKKKEPNEIWSPFVRYTGKRSDPTCQGSDGKECETKATFKWRSNLKTRDIATNCFKFEEWNCCEECGMKEFGGWYEPVEEAK